MRPLYMIHGLWMSHYTAPLYQQKGGTPRLTLKNCLNDLELEYNMPELHCEVRLNDHWIEDIELIGCPTNDDLRANTPQTRHGSRSNL